jgi:formiminoglutamase
LKYKFRFLLLSLNYLKIAISHSRSTAIMTWETRYHPPELNIWQGRADSPANACFFQTIKLLDLTHTRIPDVTHDNAENVFCLVGFCCDTGVRRNFGRMGAASGPDAIREALARLPIQKPNFTCYDAGNIDCSDEDLEAAQAALGEVINKLLAANITPIVFGGGHEVAWGHYQGIARHFKTEDLGIVNFDAHFDMRPLLPHRLGTSGTPFLQIANDHKAQQRRFDYNCIGIQHASNTHQLFETAKHWHTNMIIADDFHQGYMDKCVNFVDRVIDQNQIIYVSLCLDVFGTSYAPGVSAPQSLGLTPWQVLPLIRQLASSGKVVSYDIAELSPEHDNDHRTAKLAATFVYEIIHHHHKLKSGLHNGHHTTT